MEKGCDEEETNEKMEELQTEEAAATLFKSPRSMPPDKAPARKLLSIIVVTPLEIWRKLQLQQQNPSQVRALPHRLQPTWNYRIGLPCTLPTLHEPKEHLEEILRHSWSSYLRIKVLID